MNSVIACIDLTESSKKVVDYALNICKELNAELCLFHSYQVPVAYSEIPVVTLSLEEIKNSAEKKLIEIKKDIEDQIQNKIKVTIELVLGEPANELENKCKSRKTDLVIMGTGNSNKLERAFVGSTTLHAINHLHVPVLVVPRETVFKKLNRIGFACDFMKVEKTTPTGILNAFCERFGAALHILHVETQDEIHSKDLQEQKELLDHLLKDLKPEFHYIKNESVEQGIHQFVNELQLDLLISIPKKHKLIERIFNRTHTNDLIFHSQIPILAVHE